MMAKCFDEAHLGPLSQKRQGGKKRKRKKKTNKKNNKKQLPNVSLKSNRPDSAQRACSTGYPKLPAGPQPANHLLNSARRQNAAQYRSTSEEGAIYIALDLCEKKYPLSKWPEGEDDYEQNRWFPSVIGMRHLRGCLLQNDLMASSTCRSRLKCIFCSYVCAMESLQEAMRTAES